MPLFKYHLMVIRTLIWSTGLKSFWDPAGVKCSKKTYNSLGPFNLSVEKQLRLQDVGNHLPCTKQQQVTNGVAKEEKLLEFRKVLVRKSRQNIGIILTESNTMLYFFLPKICFLSIPLNLLETSCYAFPLDFLCSICCHTLISWTFHRCYWLTLFCQLRGKPIEIRKFLH